MSVINPLVLISGQDGKFTAYFDDFIGSQPQSALGWNALNSGVGSANTSSVGGVTSIGALGVYSINTGTTATGRSCGFAGQQALIFGQGTISYRWRVWVTNLSDAGNRYNFYVGIGDNTAAGDMTDGVYFVYSDTLNGGNWTLSTANNSARTTANSGVAVVAATWVNLGVTVNAEGTSAQFFVNGVSVGTIGTNIPTVQGRESGPLIKIEKSVGATSRTIAYDYFYMESEFTVAR